MHMGPVIQKERSIAYNETIAVKGDTCPRRLDGRHERPLLGEGLFGTLKALRMAENGFELTIIGVVLSCHSIGFMLRCL